MSTPLNMPSKAELTPSNHLLRLEAIEFADLHGLTPREKDVFIQLSQGNTTFKAIAAALTLSPSTVNNHFKSIFEKANASSKSELLAKFASHVFKKLSSCRHLVQRPRVLILDDEPDLVEVLAEQLELRGVIVHAFNDPKKALESIADYPLNAIISDIRMPKLNGVEFLKELRKTYHYSPTVVFVSGFSMDYSVDQLLNLGAVALLEKPFNVDAIFQIIMENFIQDTKERNRYFRLEEKLKLTLEGEGPLEIGNIGYGGVFVPFNPGLNERRKASLKVGTQIPFSFSLEARKISAIGEVIWRRETPSADLPPGVGIKFVQISDEDRQEIETHVRAHRILSFIPNSPLHQSNAIA